MSDSQGPCRLDISEFANSDDASTDHTLRPRYDGDRDGDDNVYDGRSQGSSHYQCQNKERQSLQDVHDALRHQVQPSTEVARDDPDDSSKHGAEKGRGDPHRKRNPSAIDDSAVDVSSEIVRAEPVGAIGTSQSVLRIGPDRVMGRKGFSKTGCQYQE